jgi:hypothetical protein
MSVILEPSTRKNKKYQVIIGDKTIHFGDSRYEDFTQHNDEERKKLYIKRHQKRENWLDPFTSGFWALNLLWNQKTLKASIKNIKKLFKINILDRVR